MKNRYLIAVIGTVLCWIGTGSALAAPSAVTAAAPCAVPGPLPGIAPRALPMGLPRALSMGLPRALSRGDYPIQPVPFTEVTVRDAFWTPRLRNNQEITLPYDFKQCEDTGRISNFAKAAGMMKGAFEGHRYNDSDVYKIIEGAAYTLHLNPDPELDRYLDELIAKIAGAQEEDGYLYTARTVDPAHPAPVAGSERWSNMQHGHELYCAGHLYEAAVAHYQATGKRTLLDVALKNADLICKVFGPEGLRAVPGHEEIEIGLCKLYRITKEAKYLDLARFFLDERGRFRERESYGAYCQDHAPVIHQHEAVGHAVRAGYLYAAMADVAALTSDEDYIRAIGRIWNDVVTKKLYITGGIGARRQGEAFGDAYELPNATAYNETCAAIANAFWNHRLFLLHGDAVYIDLLERIVYNGFLAGVSLEGNSFFYDNPLASYGKHSRSPWFGCSCCPANVVRFLPSLPGYIYAVRGEEIYVNLFIGGSASVPIENNRVSLVQETNYPWDGKIRIRVDPESPEAFAMNVRIPGWARNVPLPGGLYRYIGTETKEGVVKVNGQVQPSKLDRGYMCLEKEWKAGDLIELDLPMPVRRVVCVDQVEANIGRVALMRGPLVYCAEAIDNNGHTSNLALSGESKLDVAFEKDLLGGVCTIQGIATAVMNSLDGGEEIKGNEPFIMTLFHGDDQPFKAIPYYAWAHRGPGEMDVWLAEDLSHARVLPQHSPASSATVTASHTWQGDHREAVNDGLEPKSSNDHSIPRFTWWDHQGGEEWIQYDFDQAVKLSYSMVYWFDDTGSGGCRVPALWEMSYRKNDQWYPVETDGVYGLEKDAFNRIDFETVTTQAVRLEVQLQSGFSGGILEWRVH